MNEDLHKVEHAVDNATLFESGVILALRVPSQVFGHGVEPRIEIAVELGDDLLLYGWVVQIAVLCGAIHRVLQEG